MALERIPDKVVKTNSSQSLIKQHFENSRTGQRYPRSSEEYGPRRRNHSEQFAYSLRHQETNPKIQNRNKRSTTDDEKTQRKHFRRGRKPPKMKKSKNAILRSLASQKRLRFRRKQTRVNSFSKVFRYRFSFYLLNPIPNGGGGF